MIIAVTVPTEAAGSSLSDAANLRDLELIGIQFPATWVDAVLTFQVSDDGTNFFDLYIDSANTQVIVTTAVNANRFVGFSANTLAQLGRWNFVKVRSGLTGAHVDQTASRTINLVVKHK